MGWIRIVAATFILSAWAAVTAAPAAGATATAAAPTVNLAALRGHGELALVRDGVLYLAGGAAGGVRAVEGPGAAADPQWSPDGAWLAYTRQAPDTALTSLWVVRANGADDHRVPIGPASGGNVLAVGATAAAPVWAPRGPDLLATSAVTAHGRPAGLWLATPGGAAVTVRDAAGRMVRTAAPVRLSVLGQNPLWAPDGRTLAYTETLPYRNPVGRSDLLVTRSLTGRPVRHLLAKGQGLLLAAWWRTGRGLLYWEDPQHSASIAADGLPLYTLSLATDRSLLLADTLPYRSWIAESPTDMVAIVAGGPRLAWADKTVLQCLAVIPRQAVQMCVTVTRPGGPLTLDPAWSTSGLVYVEAKDRGTKSWGGTAAQIRAWQATRTLWWAAPGKPARRLVAAGRGVYDPVWSARGTALMVARGTDLYLVTPGAPRAVWVARGVRPPGFPWGYYGHLDYGQVMAWSDAA
jgi:hypothetical protein